MPFEKIINSELLYRFNAAAWQKEEDNRTVLIAREVVNGGREGEPDRGDMVLIELDNQGKIVHQDKVWHLDGAKHLLEDPRALVLQNGNVVIGLTAVDEEYNPYPAIATLENIHFRSKLPEVNLVKELGPGKNTTPVKDNVFFFRPEGINNNHKLAEFEFDGSKGNLLGEIVFPNDIPWASWRIGTTMSPIWRDNQEALMIIHGINIQGGKFVYSLGRARLTPADKSFSSGKYKVEVDPNPLLTPDDFLDENGNPMVEELHPELRRVVYACGGVLKKTASRLDLALYVNVGDRQTVEVRYPWKDLINGWWIN